MAYALGLGSLAAVIGMQMHLRSELRRHRTGKHDASRTASARSAGAAAAAGAGSDAAGGEPDGKGKDKGAKKKGVRIDGVFLKQLRRVLSHAIGRREVLNILALTATLVGRTWMSLNIATNMGETISAFCNQRWPETLRAIMRFGVVSIFAALLNAALKFLSNVFSMNMRQRLTSSVHKLYMRDMMYYRANKVSGLTAQQMSDLAALGDGARRDTTVEKLENADQLIVSDVDLFSNTVADLYSNLLKPTVDLIMFTWQLGSMMGASGPTGMYTWFGVATYITAKVLPPFGRLAAEEQALEGRFRASHSELIQNSEMVAFLRGEVPEKAILDTSFAALRKHVRSTLQRKVLSDFVAGYLSKYAASVVGFLLVIRPVYNGVNGMNRWTPADIASYYVSSRQCMEGLSSAVLSIFDLQKRVGKLAGLTSRVDGLLAGIQKRAPILTRQIESHRPDRPATFVHGDKIAFEHVCIFKPDGVELAHDLCFEVPKGARVLITGSNGCGKSSCFRVLKGLWPLVCGTVTLPADDKIYFLSQVNYAPIGDMRTLLAYPKLPSEMKAKGVTDDDYRQALEWAHLGDLQCDGVRPSLDDTLDWKLALSPGQKQRCAFARIFLHRPDFAILE